MMRRARRVAGVLLALAAALVVLGVALVRRGEVIARGNLLPYFEDYEVSRVRALGTELYVDFSTDVGDVLTAMVLLVAAGLMAAGVRRVRPEHRGPLAAAAAGTVFLALDDLLSVHETVGHNLGFLAALPLVDHPDDAVLGVYGLGVAAFVHRHRHLLLGSSRTPLAVAAAAAVLAVVHDLLPIHLRILEEALEVVSGAALALGARRLVIELAAD